LASAAVDVVSQLRLIQLSGAWLKQRNALRRAIIAALILWVIGLLAASLNTYFSKLERWLPWLLPNVVSGVVVVIGAVVNHVSSSGQQAEHARDGGQPPFAQSPIRRPEPRRPSPESSRSSSSWVSPP
jgi:fatty acid desaturase